MVRSLAYKEKRQEELKLQNALFHLQGQYFASAINATVGNMMQGKNRAPIKYLDKPIELKLDNEVTEQDIQNEVDLFFAQETARRLNWKRHHKDSEVS